MPHRPYTFTYIYICPASIIYILHRLFRFISIWPIRPDLQTESRAIRKIHTAYTQGQTNTSSNSFSPEDFSLFFLDRYNLQLCAYYRYTAQLFKLYTYTCSKQQLEVLRIFVAAFERPPPLSFFLDGLVIGVLKRNYIYVCMCMCAAVFDGFVMRRRGRNQIMATSANSFKNVDKNSPSFISCHFLFFSLFLILPIKRVTSSFRTA